MAINKDGTLLDFVNYYRSYTSKIQELVKKENQCPEEKQVYIDERKKITNELNEKLVKYFNSIK
ncbi:MAG: hypothetical protein J6A06_00530 [Fibrobacteraceae bacterium]|nr:hypothetical protein [Fibrobacteraceae bacterium]